MKEKFVHVGDFPCAVFGMVGPDGRSHAHRIYLAPGGAGKADLGMLANGKPRKAKKSARRDEGDNVSGRCVLWGDADRAPWMILAEGIETAAAIALVFSDLVEDGSLAIAAAISTAGIRAFKPWPATQHITVAADRDEGSSADDDRKKRAGEKAARFLVLQLHDKLQVDIAIPGSPGEKIDFLDVLKRDGRGAVRERIENAPAFVPTREELERLASERGRAAELADIKATYPLPTLDSLRLEYLHTVASSAVKVHRITRTRDSETGELNEIARPVATPIGLPARLLIADKEDTYGLRLRVRGLDGRPRDVDIERGKLAKRGAPDIMEQLLKAGLRTENDGDITIVQMLKAANPEEEIRIVSRPGWHDLASSGTVFVCPSGQVVGSGDHGLLELATGVRMAPDIARAGTLEGWRHAVEAALCADRCPHWGISAMAGFCGPLVALSGFDTIGFAISGFTTVGKSTAQRIASSAWSTPDIRKPGLFQSARSTSNALEALAQKATGTVFCYDDLAHVPGKDLESHVYALCGGVGKRRMSADGIVKDSSAWSTFALLSCEVDLRTKAVTDGGRWTPGMAVRIPDVNCDGLDNKVPNETLAAVDGINTHYGYAGPAFVASLIRGGYASRPIKIRERILSGARNLAGEDADSTMNRAALPFAVLSTAGELAKEFGIIPTWYDVRNTVAWAWESFMASGSATALAPEKDAVQKLGEFVTRAWGVTIKPAYGGNGQGTREAVGFYDDETIYLLASVISDATGGSLGERQIGSVLAEQGLLAKHDAERWTVRYIPGVGRVRAYALKRGELGRPVEPNRAPHWMDN